MLACGTVLVGFENTVPHGGFTRLIAILESLENQFVLKTLPSCASRSKQR
jgi:hypothetical protein